MTTIAIFLCLILVVALCAVWYYAVEPEMVLRCYDCGHPLTHHQPGRSCEVSGGCCQED